MNNYILEFELVDGDILKEEWETEKDIKELNKQIAQLLVAMPWYTFIDSEDKIFNINVSKIKYFTIKNNKE